MAGNLDLAPAFGNFADLVDQKGRALDAHVGLAVHGFFDPNAIGGRRLFVFVRQQLQRKVMFCDEFLVAGSTVRRDADDRGSSLFEIDG